MWIHKGDIFYDDEFPFFNLVTTKISGDMKEETARERVCSFNGINIKSLARAEQVHGCVTAVAGAKDGGSFVKGADGLATSQKGLPLAIFTADCVPVMLGAKGKACGIVHAGWRGLFKGIIPRAVKIFENEFGADPADIYASVGPHICADCYTVGEEIRKSFGLAATAANFDLGSEAAAQLKKAGINKISLNNNCTMHEPELFFSYRKDKTAARIMSVVSIH